MVLHDHPLGTITVNGNPVWVTATKNTTLYVDYTGDRVGSLTDPQGGKYDEIRQVSALEVVRLFDPDKDQTGMRVYTLDGTLIAGACPGAPPGRRDPVHRHRVLRRARVLLARAAPQDRRA